MRNGLLAAGAAGMGMLVLGGAPAKAQMTSAGIWWNAANTQSGPTTVAPNFAFFAIGATMANPSDFDGGSATYPGPNSPEALFPGAPLTVWNGQPSFPSVAAMNAAFPFGSYVVTLTNSSTNASQSEAVDYATNYAAADTPQLAAASFDALQGLSTNLSSLTIGFNSFTPQNVASDPGDAFTFFTIFGSDQSCGFLSPSATTCTIAPSALEKGTTYAWELDFSTRASVYNPTTGVYDFTNFDVRTDGSFTTAVPEPSTWAMLISGFAGLGALACRRRLAATG